MKKVLACFMLIFGTALFAQNEASYWYFGRNAGLQFDISNGSVTAITDGLINTLEGCTSISDDNGDLLFYSDGRTIWNRNHLPMSNADENLGTDLKGDDSSTSSGLIVPKPQDPTKYYIFTVDEPHHSNSSAFPNESDGDGVNNGLMYSLVDMNLNGGLGDVDLLEKNVPLITYDQSIALQTEFKCSEKITAVKANDCSSFWVITHFANRFYAFKIQASGVVTSPVISTIGPEVPVEGYRRNALGYLKASPDGSKLVVAHFGFGTVLSEDAPGGVYLFDFNNDTGVVTNSIELLGPSANTSPYGVEFSAENRKVYATTSAGARGTGASSLIQWDLESDDIPNSSVVISTSGTVTAGALQLGLDRRIYRAQFSFSDVNSGKYLGVITNPEADGSNSNFIENGILVDVTNSGNNLSRIGLPPFIQSLFNSQIDIIQNGISTTEVLLCNESTYTLNADNIPGATYIWYQDGEMLNSETTFELVVSTPGFYEVYIEPNNGDCPIEGEALVSFFEVPTITAIVNDINICDSEINPSFDLTEHNDHILNGLDPVVYDVHYYTSLLDAESNSNEILDVYEGHVGQQEIFVRVHNSGNPDCFDITSFNIIVYLKPTIESIEELAVCDEDFNGDASDGLTTIDLSSLNSQILIGLPENSFSVSYHNTQEHADSGTNALNEQYSNSTSVEVIYVRVENNNNADCYSIEAFDLVVNPAPEAHDTTLTQCDDDGINDGLTIFNLESIIEEITNDIPNTSVVFFNSEDDALNFTNPIEDLVFYNYTSPQALYALVTNDNTNCINIASITLDISITFLPNTTLSVCDDDGIEDGLHSFDIAQAFDPVIDGLPTNLDLTFFNTYEEALLEINNLEVSNYANTEPFNQTIFVRATHENACYGISEIELEVIPLPNIETDYETIYCLNNFQQHLY